MSVMGTGVAAGVAGTALQSQQQARKRDKKVREEQHSAEKVLEVFEAHIKGLEENDGDENSSARLHVEAQLRDHEDLIDDAPDKLVRQIREENKSAASDIAELSEEAKQIIQQQSPPLSPLPPDSQTAIAPKPHTTTPALPIEEKAKAALPTEQTQDERLYKHLDIQA
ncbi:hypothetical protein KS4_05950 [Poriferisphaera corsica]|uniref:Uncharacterized protein n=1 Tax=Poriferisphaera corsica TaxID=2528020 RepID=A0A517YQQ4_9BACT|nr:hypothetical protein [Poriferisphaera corsica]QDU32563.1 hypothetical protein KS4_05950 [Poriferisphaera corsica]